MEVCRMMRWSSVLVFGCLLGSFPFAWADEEIASMQELIQALHDNTEALTNWGSLGGEQCRPIQVRREASTVSLRFTLWYRIAVPPSNVSVTWLSSPDPKSAAVFVDESPEQVINNVWKSTFETRISGPNSIGVIVRCPQISYDFHLKKAQRTVTQSDVIPFHYYLNPHDEIVYAQLRNAKLLVTTADIVALTLYSHLYDPNSNQMKDTQEIGWETQPMAIVSRNVQSSPIETRIEGDTRFNMISGLIDVNFRNLQPYGQLVDDVTLSKQLIIRPDSQPHAFPQGYIGFNRHGLLSINDSVARMDCSNEDRDCEVSCDAYGNNLTRLRMYKSRSHLFGGHDVPIRNRIPFGNSYHRSISTNGRAENEDEEEARFTCVAENEAGASKTLTILVQYFIQVQVAPRMRVEYLSRSRVKVTCTVLGRPRPTISFALRYQEDYRIIEPSNIFGRRSSPRTVAYVLTSIYANPDSRTDRLQEVTCSADVMDDTGSQVGHDHRSVSIRNWQRY